MIIIDQKSCGTLLKILISRLFPLSCKIPNLDEFLQVILDPMLHKDAKEKVVRYDGVTIPGDLHHIVPTPTDPRKRKTVYCDFDRIQNDPKITPGKDSRILPIFKLNRNYK